MMNDLVFVFFSISIAIFLLGMVVMLPNILFSPNAVTKDIKPIGFADDSVINEAKSLGVADKAAAKEKKSLSLANEKARQKRMEKIEKTYRRRHEKLNV
ncbi:hypothetical protein [Zobellia barbeyronii]|uniref:Uncharacterized protein n=1 Tax=Zobellia barbeyronii TaxID=2748009 RepID=A0ABS5WFR0_9FLAO|nr:hypothetical protein [Zobellia barbeyronii]MBT2162059.1 hypothetical protein [Zobellia barbeyronii]